MPRKLSRRYISKCCALSLECMNLLQNFHLAVIEYLYRGRRAVPLQTYLLSCNNYNWCVRQWVASSDGWLAFLATSTQMLLFLCYSSYVVENKTLFLAPFLGYGLLNPQNLYIWLPLLRLNPRRRSSPGTISVKF